MPPGGVGVMRVEIDRSEHPERSAEATARRGFPGGVLMAGRYSVITPHGVWGANVSPVGDDLAKVLKLEKGVLVNDVPEESPAHKSGLRAGDVIVSASGQTVSTLGQLQDQILSRLAERVIALQLVRNHKVQKINVTW
jgi:S1-C subfamily serine protease